MTYIRKLLFLRTIYFKQTIVSIAIDYGLCLFLLFITVSLTRDYIDEFLYIYCVLAMIGLYLFIRTSVRLAIVTAELRGGSNIASTMPVEDAAAPAIDDELHTIDAVYEMSNDGTNRIYRAVFNFYQHTKYGNYLAKQAYYTVFETRLSRILPSLLFDSKTAKGRQFKYLYVGAQRVTVQAAFDDIFDTYTPETYNIDSLSFITPEVMEALINAKAYDIEIVGDKLVLYAPLIDQAGIAQLTEHGNILRQELNDNIDNYLDDRLVGDARATNVTAFGRMLLKSPVRYIPSAVVSGLAAIVVIWVAFMNDHPLKVLFNGLSIFIYILFATSLYRVMHIVRTNNQILHQFKKYHS